MIKNFGVPKLNREQFERFMNIVFIEGMIAGTSEEGNPDKYMNKRYRQGKTLNELTERKRPELLYDQMKKLSEKK